MIELECSHSNLHSDTLSLAQKCNITSTCQYSYINIMHINYCLLDDRQYITYSCLILLAVFCFYFLSNTSNKYLAPSLGIICEKLQLSQNLAGLTLLAFGNQAPDLFVAIIAGDNDGPESALCSLIGSQIFITAVILSLVVHLGNNVQVVCCNFLRDFMVFLGAIGIISVFGYIKEIVIWESICFFMLYFIYVIICVIMDKQGTNTFITAIADDNYNDPHMSRSYKIEVFDKTVLLDPSKVNLNDVIEESYFYKKNQLTQISSHNVSVIYSRFHYNSIKESFTGKESEDNNCTWYSVLYYIFVYPFDLIRDLTIPPFEKYKWNRWIFIIMPLTLPSFIIVIMNLYSLVIDNYIFTIGFYGLMIFISIIIFFNTYRYTLPPCEWGLLITGFIMSILWLWFMSNILMESIFAIQLLLPIDIPQSFFNMTIVSLGNSFPDLFVSIALAQTGYAEMAFSGSIGAPVFGLLFSFGLTLIKTHLTHSVIQFDIFDWDKLPNKLLIIGIICLAGNAIRMIIQGIIIKFMFNKWSSFIGYMIYVGYLIAIFYFTFI